MSARQFPQLIVGVDRSPGGRAALRVAAAEAIRRGVPLHAVRVRAFPFGPVDDFTHIDAAIDETFRGVPEGLDLRRSVLDAPVAKGLTDRAHHPGDLLILGSRRPGASRWWHRIWSRSTVQGCLRRARCPVLVVTGNGPQNGMSPVPRGGGTLWWGECDRHCGPRRHARIRPDRAGGDARRGRWSARRPAS
jgi:nucleotide-binding universal stress UspA family protein